MQDADVFIVIGYSFRDHLNDSFLNFLNKGNTKLIIISPTAISDHRTHLLKKKRKEGQKRGIAIRGTFAANFTTAGDVSRIYCIQKPLKVENIDELIKDVKKHIDENLKNNPDVIRRTVR